MFSKLVGIIAIFIASVAGAKESLPFGSEVAYGVTSNRHIKKNQLEFYEAYNTGNLKGALKVLNTKTFKLDWQAHVVLADLYLQNGLYQSFIEEILPIESKMPVKLQNQLRDTMKNFEVDLKTQVLLPESLRTIGKKYGLQKLTPPDELVQARADYKKGKYADAVKGFQKISLDSPYYIQSREELAWAYLRDGDHGSLRGLLQHVNSKIVPERLRLEGRVMSAISYLQACEYDEVRDEIQIYQKEMKNLAHTDLEAKSDTFFKAPSDIPELDRLRAQFLNLESQEQLALTASKALAQPAALAKTMAKKRWQIAFDKYRRVLAHQFDESLLKMRVVRLEFLSQLKNLEKTGLAANTKIKGEASSPKNIAGQSQVFRISRDVWADEIFKAKATVTSFCKNIRRSM